VREGRQPAAAAPLGKGTVSHTAETYGLKCNIKHLHLTNADTLGTPFTEKGLLKATQPRRKLKLNIWVSNCKFTVHGRSIPLGTNTYVSN